MGKDPLITMYLVISCSDVQMDFDECTTEIGIAPTYTARSKIASLPGSEWGIGFEKRNLYSIDLAFDELFGMIVDYKEKIKEFAYNKRYVILIICSVRIIEDPPLYEISCSHIKALAELDAEFRLDIYDHSE